MLLCENSGEIKWILESLRILNRLKVIEKIYYFVEYLYLHFEDII